MALDFLAELNQRGCSRSTYELYVHVVWDFHRHAGQVLGLKLKRRKTLPPYIPWSHAARLLAQAEKGLQTYSPEASSFSGPTHGGPNR